MSQSEYLVQAINVKKYYKVGRSRLKAVDDVNIGIRKGETFGLVGESGCGKSTLSLMILRLAGRIEGSVLFEGRDIYAMRPRELRDVRREMQIIFQDPFDSLNPRMKLGDIVAEPLHIHKIGSHEERGEQVRQLFDKVGLPAQQLDRYPHQLSGGQRQRVSIARALALSPKLIVCDEAVSALDVSIQSQILNLLWDLKKELGLTFLFVSHDLSVVRFISDRIGVMYFGSLVEVAGKHELFQNHKHPYTHALLSAKPNPDPRNKSCRVILRGDVPSLINRPVGCIFHERCAYTQPRCEAEAPVLTDIGGGHEVACHRAQELSLNAGEGAL